ncbi:MAG: metallophosphatase [Verrucomicrobia bacterium]|nr:metallophosphatase [Verrucomicrobiota bacterium]
MRTLIHLSDLHFGRVDRSILDPLREFVIGAKPHLVVVSGDLTQRARPKQFAAARAFLDSLGCPLLVVPGNHDIPFYNVLARFARPLTHYRRYIGADLSPFFRDDEIAVAGLNTARSLTTKYGRLNPRQIAQLHARFDGIGDGVTKVVVTHHPFDLPDDYKDRQQLVGGAEGAMAAMAKCGVDLVLSGHLHLSHHALSAVRYKVPGHSALVVQAGTATSTRGRGEENSFNRLAIEPGRIRLERVRWIVEEKSLKLDTAADYRRVAKRGWEKVGKGKPQAPASKFP